MKDIMNQICKIQDVNDLRKLFSMKRKVGG